MPDSFSCRHARIATEIAPTSPNISEEKRSVFSMVFVPVQKLFGSHKQEIKKPLSFGNRTPGLNQSKVEDFGQILSTRLRV